jgi:hypothetical protein
VFDTNLTPAITAGCAGLYSDFVHAKTGGSDQQHYTKMVFLQSPTLAEECATKLREIHTLIGTRRFPLRDVLLQRSGSPEAFIASRARFIASFVAGAAACYITGVGDRHLGNMMIDDAGVMHHIDFGYSFGQGALLSVPELQPARLTRALTEAAAPLDCGELLAADLGVALQALHLSRAPLLAALEAFVRQPLLAWDRAAFSLFRSEADPPASLRSLRMSTVRAKLSCGSPVHILLKELSPKYPEVPQGAPPPSSPAEACLRQQRRALEELLTGDTARGCARTEIVQRYQDGVLASTREQADVLLDISRDASIVMRAWSGWRSWM